LVLTVSPADLNGLIGLKRELRLEKFNQIHTPGKEIFLVSMSFLASSALVIEANFTKAHPLDCPFESLMTWDSRISP